ncbi:hypothetical protein Fcan01_21946 [Folsomia candida]|uniref:Uncharacterized protein n=1 Tax=Folsomia candida TaxID=158441 RepID=A0A226DCX8_FOLCA|nr:hypothetical protein Fcan01_21946 [Folsomia candida]
MFSTHKFILILLILPYGITEAPLKSEITPPPCDFLNSDKTTFEIRYTSHILSNPRLSSIRYWTCSANHYCGNYSISRDYCPEFLKDYYFAFELPIRLDFSVPSLIQVNHSIIFSDATSPVEVITRLSKTEETRDLFVQEAEREKGNVFIPDYHYVDFSVNPDPTSEVVVRMVEFENSDSMGHTTSYTKSCRHKGIICGDEFELGLEPFGKFIARYSQLTRGLFGFRKVEGAFTHRHQVGSPWSTTVQTTVQTKGTDGVSRESFEETIKIAEKLRKMEELNGNYRREAMDAYKNNKFNIFMLILQGG